MPKTISIPVRWSPFIPVFIHILTDPKSDAEAIAMVTEQLNDLANKTDKMADLLETHELVEKEAKKCIA